MLNRMRGCARAIVLLGLSLFILSTAKAQFPYPAGSPMLPGESTSKYGAGPTPTKAGDGVGAFRILCFATHISHDDPIKFPGQYYASHEHIFFGNALTDANSTPASLAAGGFSTCHGGILDRTAYWTPTLQTKANQVMVPYQANFYYKLGYGGAKPSQVQNYPAGLEIIAGDPMGMPGQASYNHRWLCQAPDGSGTIGPTIPDCAAWALDNGENPATMTLVLQVIFPQCWDGKNLYKSDGSHMAYAVPPTGCPADHPVVLPEITYNIDYLAPYTAGAAAGTNFVAGYHLSSDMYDVTEAMTACNATSATSQPITIQCSAGGYSAHADWIGAFNTTIENTFVANCIKASMDCNDDEVGLLWGVESELFGIEDQSDYGTKHPMPANPWGVTHW